MTEQIEYQEMIINDNIDHVIKDIIDEACENDEPLRDQLKQREASLTKKDNVINNLENAIGQLCEENKQLKEKVDLAEAAEEEEANLSCKLLEEKDKIKLNVAIKHNLGDSFTLLRHQIQDLEELKESFVKAMNEVNNTIDHLEDHFL
tara:strand:+ start:3232 stop:3675 length:444 start_codon:yes stop_codon:yes gene_type:complete